MIETHQVVDYNDTLHRYSYEGTTYTSATQLLHQFIPPFNSRERSEYMAYRYGQTPDYWVQKWKAENKKSLVRGVDIHDTQEEDTYRKKFIELSPYRLPVIRHNKAIPFHELIDGVYPEMLLWSHKHRMAGRSDKVILTSYNISSTHPGRVADIEDYKTNKKINQFSFQDKQGNYRMLKFPLNHVMDSEYWHYTLQLSIYQFMLELMGFKPGKREIIHFPHEIEGLGTPPPVRYELPYMRDEVKLMLKYRKEALDFV